MAKKKVPAATGARSKKTAPPLPGSQKIVAFAATVDPARAKAFYRDTLGLRLVSDDQFALVFRVRGTMLRVTTVPELVTAPYTVLGWEVTNIVAAVKALGRRGVAFQRYPGLPQDDLGIWTAPGHARVAWFKDPDGNTLSLTQH